MLCLETGSVSSDQGPYNSTSVQSNVYPTSVLAICVRVKCSWLERTKIALVLFSVSNKLGRDTSCHRVCGLSSLNPTVKSD